MFENVTDFGLQDQSWILNANGYTEWICPIVSQKGEKVPVSLWFDIFLLYEIQFKKYIYILFYLTF